MDNLISIRGSLYTSEGNTMSTSSYNSLFPYNSESGPPSSLLSSQSSLLSVSSSSSSHSFNSYTALTGKVGTFIRITFTCIVAAVGSLVGAITGSLIGVATENGLLRGAGVGAISGAVFTIEAVESSLAIWHATDSGIWSLLYVIDIAYCLFNGRLVREKVGPAMRSAVESQMRELDSPLMDVIDIFDTGSRKGMTKDSICKLPIVSITSLNIHVESCVVCLQDFETGDSVRYLPHCQHVFHLHCIDGWLLRHGSCPLCRGEFQIPLLLFLNFHVNMKT